MVNIFLQCKRPLNFKFTMGFPDTMYDPKQLTPRPQGVELAYLQTGISGVFLGFEFRKSVFLGVLLAAAVFF